MSTILVTGANRGLGLELVKQYLGQGDQVIALCRDPDNAPELNALSGKLDVEKCDISNFSEVDRLAEKISDTPIDIIINNAGAFGPKEHLTGDLRQSFGHMDYSLWADLFNINCMASMKVAESLIDNIRAGSDKKIINITAILGSIGTTDKGFYAYRSSKAAINMTMRALSIELAAEGITVLMLNPGWVKTDMGGDKAPFTPEQSVRNLRKLISEKGINETGSFFEYDGSTIPF